MLADRLPEAQKAALREHLGRCPACRSVLDGRTARPDLRRWLTGTPPASDEATLRQLLHGLHAALTTPDNTPRGTASVPPYLGPVVRPGDLGSLGPFRIEAELGRGGMGIVYRARDETLDRTVALKVLRSERTDAESRARLVREAQLVARFRHDHVVAVHAVVDPPDGLPYVVMEHIDGPSLKEMIRGRGRLEPRKAASLLAQVADGLAAAHAAGLVHRDVKPSNVLFDLATERARLVDFGLARAVAQPSGLTREGAVAGTPAYMSPEQVEGRPVDGRADVYSPGVTLYEALTGEVPFRGTDVMVLRQIVAEEPRPPRRLNDAVPRDLETVCLKAMAKEPARRYATAAAFAADLRRFRNDEPIRARPAGPVERGWRWCRRNPGLAILSVALVTVVLVGAGGVGWEWREAVRQRDRAFQEQAQARKDFQRARRAVETFLTEVGEHPELQAANLDPVRRRLLQTARDFYEEFVRDHTDDPELQADLGRAYGRLGQVVMFLESQPAGLEPYEKQRDVFQRLHESHPEEASYRSELADAHLGIGLACWARGDLEGAGRACEKAHELLRGLTAADPEQLDYRYHLARCLFKLGMLRDANPASIAESERFYTDGRELVAALAEKDPGRPSYRSLLAQFHNKLGRVNRSLNRPGPAREHFQKAIALCDDLLRAHPGNPDYQQYLGSSLNELGILYAVGRRPADAEVAWKRAADVFAELARLHPDSYDSRAEAANILGNRGTLLFFELNRAAEAEAALRQALAVQERLTRARPAVAEYWRPWSSNHAMLAALLRNTGRPAASAEVLDGAVTRLEADFPAEKRTAVVRGVLAQLHALRADALGMLGRYAESRDGLEQAVQLGGGSGAAYRDARDLAEAVMRAQKGEHAVAVRTAATVLERLKPGDLNRCVAAGVCALAAAAVRQDERLQGPERIRLSEQYATQAVAWLREARTAFYAPSHLAAYLLADRRLEPLRERADFQKLLAELKGRTRRENGDEKGDIPILFGTLFAHLIHHKKDRILGLRHPGGSGTMAA